MLTAPPTACRPYSRCTLQLLECMEIGQPLSSLWVAICVIQQEPLVLSPDWLLSTGSGQTRDGMAGCSLCTRQFARLCEPQQVKCSFTCSELSTSPAQLPSADSDLEMSGYCHQDWGCLCDV